jgi:hypothetical protein
VTATVAGIREACRGLRQASSAAAGDPIGTQFMRAQVRLRPDSFLAEPAPPLESFAKDCVITTWLKADAAASDQFWVMRPPVLASWWAEIHRYLGFGLHYGNYPECALLSSS